MEAKLQFIVEQRLVGHKAKAAAPYIDSKISSVTRDIYRKNRRIALKITSIVDDLHDG